MVKTARLFVVMGLFACAAAGALAADDAAATPDKPQTSSAAEALLRRVADAYLAHDTYRADIALRIQVTANGRTQRARTQVAVRVARPDRFHVRSEDEEETLEFTSDGKTLWTYFSGTNKWLPLPAPPRLDMLLGEPLMNQALMGMTPVTLGLFSSDPYAALTRWARSTEVVPPTPGEEQEQDRVALQLRGGRADLWIDRQTRQVVRVKVVPDEPAEADPDAGRPEVLIEAELEAKGGVEFAADAFTFRPPEGAREAQTVQDLFTPDLTGKPFIDLTLPGLDPGTKWRLADYKGKVIALTFWATWCPPCREELPQLARIYSDLRSEGLMLLAVNAGEERQKVREWKEDLQLSLPVALDEEGVARKAYWITKLPTLVLIDRQGVIRKVHQGYVPGTERDIRKAIEKLLAEEQPAAD